jgi:hypothetical protein
VVALAELVHEAAAPLHQDLVVVVRTRSDHLDLALWPIADPGPSPTEVLIGWRPEPGARAVGLVSAGHEHGPARTGPVSLTVLTDVHGGSATVLERPDRPPLTVTDPPQGWGADALRRTLGLPTPPPDHPVSACVEVTWLAHVAALAWPAGQPPAPPLDWPRVARVHPLVELGAPVPTPHDLARATRSLDTVSSWSRLLHQAAADLPAGPTPPGGRTVPLVAWFDQGSFSRWMLRRQPDADQLLFDLLDHLTDEAAEQLLAALVSL